MSIWHNNCTSAEFNPPVLAGNHVLVQRVPKLWYNICPLLSKSEVAASRYRCKVLWQT